MDNNKNDVYYIQKIITDLQFIEKHTKDIDSVELGLDEVLLDSMMFRLIQISENSKKLSENYKASHPTIPWTAIYGFRNRIVHDYGHVDLSIVFKTIKEDVPILLDLMENE